MPFVWSIRRFLRNSEGAAAIEFAICAIPLFFVMIGTIEYGLISYTQVAVESALTQAARTASIGGVAPDSICAGSDRVCYITTVMEQKINSLPNSDLANVTMAVVEVPGVSPTRLQDVCLLDTYRPHPETCPGAFLDNNSNGLYDPPSAGAAGQLVEIRVTYPWKVLTPMIGEFFPPDGTFVINTAIVIKNEPF